MFPTICDILDLPKPEWLQGVSLVPLFINTEEVVREEIFTEISFHAAYEPVRSIRTKRYKLIKRYDQDQSPVPANADGCPAKSDLIEAGYYIKNYFDNILLFDLKVDPLEKNNLAKHVLYKDILDVMVEKLQQWMKQTDDPLLCNDNQILIPKGGLVNKRDCIEAIESDFI